MPLPDIFTEGTPQDEKLARYFEEMYEYLADEGVPEDRLPSPWHMLSRMVKCIDPELVREWLDAYVGVETEFGDEEDSDEDGEADLDLNARSGKPERPQRGKMKRRPTYLRAIDASSAGEDKRDDDDETPTEEPSDSDADPADGKGQTTDGS